MASTRAALFIIAAFVIACAHAQTLAPASAPASAQARPPPPPRRPPPPPPPPRNICFPGDAQVVLPNGGFKSMSQLAVGDQVAVGQSPSGLIYSEIYAFGHKDPSTFSDFVQVKLQSEDGSLQDTVELSAGHFMLTFSEDGARMSYKRASELKVGDYVQTTIAANSTILPIKGLAMVEKTGLYNPFTLTGTILVNGVVASVHSDWFLDPVFDRLGVTGWLPVAYQALLFPARCLYSTFGSKIYSAGYKLLDDHLDIAQLGTQYGGPIAMAAIAAVAAASMATTKVLLK